MDTFAEISCYSADKGKALNAMSAAFKEMKRIEKLFNRFDEKSELSKVNTIAGVSEASISPELFNIIERSIYYTELSDGDFDITIAPIVDIWSSARKNKKEPDLGMIEEALRHARYDAIVLDKERMSVRFLDKDLKIDLGGIAKGYAVDRAKDILLLHGIENALVNIGGNIFALGNPPNKAAWRIGIRDPRNKRKIIHRLNIKDRAVSTSGDYERPYHIINPQTGRPAEGIMSVTIVADSAEEADALSTAVFVMGAEYGLDFIKALGDKEVFIFDSAKKLTKYP